MVKARVRSVERLLIGRDRILNVGLGQTFRVNLGKSLNILRRLSQFIIALRIYVSTLFECGIDTIAKAIKFIPPLPHPILEHKPPMLDFVQIRRIGREIPDFTSGACHLCKLLR